MLAGMFRTPSSFADDPRGFAFNQGGHAGVGMLLAWAFGLWVLLPLGVAYAAWEGIQWRRYGGDDWDCVQDWCFVMTGAVAAHQLALLPILAAWLLAGYLRRVDAASG
jgi:hypothetical protein